MGCRRIYLAGDANPHLSSHHPRADSYSDFVSYPNPSCHAHLYQFLNPDSHSFFNKHKLSNRIKHTNAHAHKYIHQYGDQYLN